MQFALFVALLKILISRWKTQRHNKTSDSKERNEKCKGEEKGERIRISGNRETFIVNAVAVKCSSQMHKWNNQAKKELE